MAVKIKLTRLGKIRNPQYRIAVADARTRRDGRVDRGHRPVPPEGRAEPDRDQLRARAVLAFRGRSAHRARLKLLKITGDWQKFKGLPGAEGTAEGQPAKPSKLELFNAALAAAEGGPTTEAAKPKKKAPAKKAAAKAEEPAPRRRRQPRRARRRGNRAAAEAATETPAEQTDPRKADGRDEHRRRRRC